MALSSWRKRFVPLLGRERHWPSASDLKQITEGTSSAKSGMERESEHQRVGLKLALRNSYMPKNMLLHFYASQGSPSRFPGSADLSSRYGAGPDAIGRAENSLNT